MNSEIYYILTYSELEERRWYLNGTSWLKQSSALEEFERILKQVIHLEALGQVNLRTDWQLEKIENGKRLFVRKLNIWSRAKFDPKCGEDEFFICSSNSDSNCFRKRKSYSKTLVTKCPEVCDQCVYNKPQRP